MAKRSVAARKLRLRESQFGCPIPGQNDEQIDKKLVTHDVVLRDIYEKLRPLLNPPILPRKEMGFHASLRKSSG